MGVEYDYGYADVGSSATATATSVVPFGTLMAGSSAVDESGWSKVTMEEDMERAQKKADRDTDRRIREYRAIEELHRLREKQEPNYRVYPPDWEKDKEVKPKNRLAHLKVDVRRCLCSENLWN